MGSSNTEKILKDIEQCVSMKSACVAKLAEFATDNTLSGFNDEKAAAHKILGDEFGVGYGDVNRQVACRSINRCTAKVTVDTLRDNAMTSGECAVASFCLATAMDGYTHLQQRGDQSGMLVAFVDIRRKSVSPSSMMQGSDVCPQFGCDFSIRFDDDDVAYRYSGQCIKKLPE